MRCGRRFSRNWMSKGGRVSAKSAAYKRNERESWNKFSARYVKVAIPEFRPFGRRLVELAGLKKGMWALDVATGPGEPALTIARRVGPRGLVLGVDFSPAMIRLARGRAKRAGAGHAHFREMDAEQLRLADMTFDRAFCRFGLMLMPDAARALREMRRVLVPGGRLAVAVWSARTKVNTLDIVRRVLERYDACHPPPGAPDFFRFGKAGAVERALRAAGFRQVRAERLTVEWIFKGPDEFWDSMKRGPSLRRALARVSPAVRRAVKGDVLRALEKFRRNGKLRIPNEAVLALGIK
ncbi:MAG: methyltransferase domain-containing protein [Nitrospirae bacterium]|nr:MAG: methyltransferase domain-containing protein [Nitrospirota bacterium]